MSEDLRQNPCTLGTQTGPQTIIVRQVIGEAEKQKALDIHIRVPDPKPPIEQIVDVFVKDVDINSIDVITNKVIVRGDFEIKAIYVACVPDQAVHAVEIKHYKWTIDIPIDGALRGMDADATVDIEFVDYDCAHWTRAYKYKNYESNVDECDDHHHHHHHHGHDCGDYDDYDDCDECDDHHHDDCDDGDHHHHHHGCTRDFDVSVVLRVNAKVLSDREVMLNTGGGGGGGTVPTKPKG